MSTYINLANTLQAFGAGVATSVVTAFVVALIRVVFLKLLHSRSPLTGKWTDRIYSDDGEVIKQDRLTLHHNPRTHEIRGVIRRTYPAEQEHKRWKVRGIAHNDHMSLVFYANNNNGSDGIIYATAVDDFRYSGMYIKRGVHGGPETVDIDLSKDGMSDSAIDLLGSC